MGMFDKMKEAKNMYSNIKKAQNEINKIKVEGISGAGAVKVVVKGNHQIVSISIDEEASKGNKKTIPRAQNLVFINQGDGTFKDESKSFGIKSTESFSTGISIGDFNIDNVIKIENFEEWLYTNH